MPPVPSLWAVEAKVLDRFMQAPIAVRRAPVAIIPILRLRTGCASKEQKPAEYGCRQYSLAEHGLQQMLMQLHNILPRTPPRLVQGPRPVQQTPRRGKCCCRVWARPCASLALHLYQVVKVLEISPRLGWGDVLPYEIHLGRECSKRWSTP